MHSENASLFAVSSWAGCTPQGQSLCEASEARTHSATNFKADASAVGLYQQLGSQDLVRNRITGSGYAAGSESDSWKWVCVVVSSGLKLALKSSPGSS